jgi:HPr kinase/phosphorylase
VASATVHATCVVVGEAGILIRGPSGSGKSRLAREIVASAGDHRFARLVCDDRVLLENRAGRLIARAVPTIAGRLEMRGIGLIPVPYEPAAVVRLVVDVALDHAKRLPDEAETAEISGIVLPRVTGRLESLTAAALWQVNVIMTGS